MRTKSWKTVSGKKANVIGTLAEQATAALVPPEGSTGLDQAPAVVLRAAVTHRQSRIRDIISLSLAHGLPLPRVTDRCP